MLRDEGFEEQLNAALVTRPTIEQAKGVLVTLRSASPDQAFAELRYASQTHNVKLRELAGALVETAAGRTPGDPELRKVIWHEWGTLLPGFFEHQWPRPDCGDDPGATGPV